MQFGTTLRNNRLDQIETTAGTTPLLQLWSGSLPANCAAADSGTKLAEMALPSDWMAAASGGSKAKSGTWQTTGLAGAGAGTSVVHFRIKDSAGTTCHVQGNVTVTGGGGDMQVDNVSVANGQTVTVNSFTITDGNA